MWRILLLAVLELIFVSQSNAADVVLKSTTYREETHIGDYWIAEDLSLGFQKMGVSTTIDYRDEYHRLHVPHPKMSIYMRGYTKFIPPYDEGVTVLYCYYPMAYFRHSGQKKSRNLLNSRALMPHLASLDDDWQNFDIITVASSSYTKKLNDAGISAYYVPQFTNPAKFYPQYDQKIAHDILFVGSNWHYRTSLHYAIDSGFDVAVYGYNWQDVVPADMYKGQYIENQDLHRYYSSAKIVLNDHRPDMKEFGFINNRIYDATASGALVISDYMPEIEQAYGDSIPMYKTQKELVYLLRYYLSHDAERQEKARRARQITLQNFTNTAVAQKINDIARKMSKNPVRH